MRNIELKARLRDRAAASRGCENLGAIAQGDLWQRDTYFRVTEGRFKLRELKPGDDYLVFYRRPDVQGVKGCDYVLEPARASIRDVLSQALGTIAVVEKVRTLYLWHNVRIHLDRVVELGDFIEFEAVLDESHDDADGFRKLEQLQEALGLNEVDIEPGSYLDLTLARTRISP
jgi:predicted adenylyl cyclase CyaB